MLRVISSAPSHAQSKAQRAQLIEFLSIVAGAGTSVGREVVREAELVLARAWKSDRVDPPVFSKEMGLFSVGTKAGKKPWFETKEDPG